MKTIKYISEINIYLILEFKINWGKKNQTENHHRKEHWLKIGLIDLIKSCQQNLDSLRGIL